MNIESVSEFIKEIINKTQRLSGVDSSEIFWFRGEGSESYKTPLIPASYRMLGETIIPTENDLFNSNDVRQIENNVHASFVRKAMPYIVSSGIENSAWNRYFLMQHYNIKTRLLDWTENALIALFFAISENTQSNENAVVWILRPYRLNTFSVCQLLGVNKDYNFIPYGYDKSEPSDLLDEEQSINITELVRRYFYMEFEKGENDLGIYHPIAIYPTYLDQRMNSQKSCFTIFGNKINGLLSNKNDQDIFLDKVIIPSASKARILNELRILGIDYTSVNPDLDGLGKSINQQFESAYRDNSETLFHVLENAEKSIKPAGNTAS